MNANKKFGLKIIVVAIIIGIIETWYFGWNHLPASFPEAIWDGVVLMLLGYSLSFTTNKKCSESEDNDLTI